jgi:hypothetical protein
MKKIAYTSRISTAFIIQCFTDGLQFKYKNTSIITNKIMGIGQN